MCILILISSPVELPFHKFSPSPFEELESRIYVGESRSLEKSGDFKAIFPGRFVYNVCADFTGDGCGFCGDFDSANRCREELSEFVEQALVHSSDLSLYVAPDDFGESGVLPFRFDCLGPCDIRTWKNEFWPNEFFQLIE